MSWALPTVARSRDRMFKLSERLHHLGGRAESSGMQKVLGKFEVSLWGGLEPLSKLLLYESFLFRAVGLDTCLKRSPKLDPTNQPKVGFSQDFYVSLYETGALTISSQQSTTLWALVT